MDTTSADPRSLPYDTHMDAEAQEDILLLKAHMGLFDAYLGKTEQQPHLVDPHPIEHAQLLPTQPKRPTTPESSRHSIVEILNDSDEEELAKGESSKKRRADRPVVIDLDAEEDDQEEDLEAMKMKRYDAAPQDAPVAKRPCPLPHPTETQSAPATPIPSVKAKTMLIATGRYYDDTTVSNQVKNCRFCAAAHGITFHEPNSNNSRMACYNCGGNHIARECRNIMCYNCWEMGHRSHACTNPRAPKATCYRCGGQHDALDCLPYSGVARLGASESNKKSSSSEAVPLPLMCPNCGFSGHHPRDCRLATLEDTNHAFERDGPDWLPRMRREVQSIAARLKTPEKSSNKGHLATSDSRENFSKVSKSPMINQSQQSNSNQSLQANHSHHHAKHSNHSNHSQHANHSNHSNHSPHSNHKSPNQGHKSKSLPNTPKASSKSHAQHNHQRHRPQSQARPQSHSKQGKQGKSNQGHHGKKK